MRHQMRSCCQCWFLSPSVNSIVELGWILHAFCFWGGLDSSCFILPPPPPSPSVALCSTLPPHYLLLFPICSFFITSHFLLDDYDKSGCSSINTVPYAWAMPGSASSSPYFPIPSLLAVLIEAAAPTRHILLPERVLLHFPPSNGRIWPGRTCRR
jgi:hypothetical protein